MERLTEEGVHSPGGGPKSKGPEQREEASMSSEHRVRLLSTQTSVTLPSSPARQVATLPFNVARPGSSERYSGLPQATQHRSGGAQTQPMSMAQKRSSNESPRHHAWIPVWAPLLMTVWLWASHTSSLGLDFSAQWTGQHPNLIHCRVTSVSRHRVCLRSETGTVGLAVCTLFERPHYRGAQSLTEVIFQP